MKFKHNPMTQESLEPRHEALLAALWEIIILGRLSRAFALAGKWAYARSPMKPCRREENG